MLDFVILVNRQGKIRLARWYHPGLSIQHRQKISTDLPPLLLQRIRSRRSLCNVIDIPAPYRHSASGMKHAQSSTVRIVYRRYASLFFLFALELEANVLLALDLIHRLVETLDRYFGSVCELDLVFNFHKAAYLLDEMMMGGLVAETSAKKVLEAVQGADSQEASEKEEAVRALTPKIFQY